MFHGQTQYLYSALNIPFESEQKQKFQITKSSVSHAKRKYSLTLDNFSPSCQQLVLSYILYPCKCPDVRLQRSLTQFWPNKHFRRRTCSVGIVSLLTWQNASEGDMTKWAEKWPVTGWWWHHPRNIIRRGLDIVTDKTKKKKPKAILEPRPPSAARLKKPKAVLEPRPPSAARLTRRLKNVKNRAFFKLFCAHKNIT